MKSLSLVKPLCYYQRMLCIDFNSDSEHPTIANINQIIKLIFSGIIRDPMNTKQHFDN